MVVVWFVGDRRGVVQWGELVVGVVSEFGIVKGEKKVQCGVTSETCW